MKAKAGSHSRYQQDERLSGHCTLLCAPHLRLQIHVPDLGFSLQDTAKKSRIAQGALCIGVVPARP